MASGVRPGAAWQQIQRLFGLGTISGLTEWELLNRYADRRDEAAFEALVARHGSMVLGVCRRVLNDPEDIEDAFQATFLVLMRKARVLRPHDAVGHWLYGVAHRVALRARSEAAWRKARERPVAEFEDLARAVEDPGRPHDVELGQVLDEEIKRLPKTYRAAVVLCYLEGQTHEEAARQLGWPVGTVKGRLARARDLLRGRLTRRGLALASGSLGALLAREAEAAVPSLWVETTVKAAIRFAAGKATAGMVSASATALAEGVLWAMILNQLKTAAAVLAVIAAVAVGATAYSQQTGENGPPVADAPKEPPRAETPERHADPVAKSSNRTAPAPALSEPTAEPGVTADPAVTRIPNSVAARGYQLAVQEYGAGKVKAETVDLWSRRLMEQDSAAPDGSRRAQAAEGHRKRMALLEHLAHRNPSTTNSLDDLNARYYREQAETLAKGAGTENDAAGPKANSTEPGKDARSLAILKKLDAPVDMAFANETPIEDILRYVKEVTKSSDFPNGLPIYVDPAGLEEAEKTMNSPVRIDLEGVPLRRTLSLALGQLGLWYHVEDGMIYITSDSSEDAGGTLPQAIQKPWPILFMQEKAERGEMSPAERKAFIEMLKDLQEIKTLLHGPKGIYNNQ